MELTSPDQWYHVSGAHNPADCASCGLFPSELLQHKLWWSGPEWLHAPETEWSSKPMLVQIPEPIEEKEICLHALADTHPMLPILERFSSLGHLKRITAWIFHFVENCRLKRSNNVPNHDERVDPSRQVLVRATQAMLFPDEIESLKKGSEVHAKDACYPFTPSLMSMHCFVWVEE